MNLIYINGMPYEVIKEFSTGSDAGESKAWVAADMKGNKKIIFSVGGKKFFASREDLISALEINQKATDDLKEALNSFDNDLTHSQKYTNYVSFIEEMDNK